MNKNIIICVSLLLVLQVLVWFQLNGQLIWKWFKDNPLILCITGMPITYGFWLATKYGYQGFDEQLWPIRLLGFATGMISFPFITYFLLGEGITIKTGVSIILAIIIMLIQLI